jgi:hypothetical protein
MPNFSGGIRGVTPIDKFNWNIFHKIDLWNFGVNDVNDYFLITEPTPVVIAPGSDMPYCLVHWVDGVPGNGDGWPAQAANPGAYVSLLKGSAPLTDETTWAPILLSHIPTILQPGYYVPALPQMAYCGDQWDHEHAWDTDMFAHPEVLLMISPHPVEMNPYQFTTVAHSAGAAITYTQPWLISPIAAGLVASTSNLVWSKLIGFGASNRTGSNQTAVCNTKIWMKNRTYPDIVANFEHQDSLTIAAVENNTRDNVAVERFGWFKTSVNFDVDAGATPAGVGFIVY